MSDVKTQADVTDVRPLDLEAARIAVKPIVDAELQAERPVGCLRCTELQRDLTALQSRCEAAERDARRYKWLRCFLEVGRDEPESWTCWLQLQQIPYRSKTEKPDELLDALIERFPDYAAIKEAGHE